MSYRARLVATVCLLVLVTGGAVWWIGDRHARTTNRQIVVSLLEETSRHVVTHTRAFVLRAGPVVESLAGLGGTLDLEDPEQLAASLLAILEANPGLTWLSFADADGSFTGAYRVEGGAVRVNRSWIEGGRTRLVERERDASGGWRVVREEADSGYDPRSRPFYRKAAAADELVWLPPYRFFGTAGPGVTCAKAVRRDGEVAGVFTADFDLFALSRFVARLDVSEGSRAFLFTRGGTVLAYPSRFDAGDADDPLPTLADLEDGVVRAYRRALPAVEAADVATAGFVPFEFEHHGERYLASATFFPIGDGWWAVGLAAPESDFTGGLRQGDRLALLAAGVALLVAVVVAVLLARRVSRPVVAMVGFMERVGGGDLDAAADFGRDREFRRVAAALNRMMADVRDRLRMRHSLDVASQVQQRLLPSAPPRVCGLDVAGHSTYCDQTGGDYYDFLLVGEQGSERLLVALGDVMGHGVAAALVMAGARAVLRDRAGEAGTLADLMNRLNGMLVDDLGGSRFMTMHLGVLSPREGRFRWVSAGHDPAVVYDPESDAFARLDGGDLPLGVAADTRYPECVHEPLRPGQVILVGTDGIWEMQNGAGEPFGKRRMHDAIRAAAHKPAAAIATELTAALAAFRGPCPTKDDVTFVVVKIEAVAEAPPGASSERGSTGSATDETAVALR